MHSTSGRERNGDKKKLTIETVDISTPTGSRSGLPTPDPEQKKTIETEAPLPPRTPDLSLPSQSNSRGKRRDSEAPMPMPSIVPTDDMQKVGATLAKMHQTLEELSRSHKAFEKQGEDLKALHQSMKLQEEVKAARKDLEDLIDQQKKAIKDQKDKLEELLKAAFRKDVEDKINVQICDAVKTEVEQRVKAELEKQIHQDLKDRSQQHHREMGRIKVGLRNDDARRRNANLKRTERLHPLFLPSAAEAISRSSSGSAAYPTPYTAGGQLQTPVNSNSLHLSTVGINTGVDNGMLVSPAFPPNMQSLCEYVNDKDKLRQFFDDYEIDPQVDLNDDQQMVPALNKALRSLGLQTSVIRPPAPQVAATHGLAAPQAGNELLSPLIIAEQ
jgi:hypothetical protein